jgi:hypothetical protein
MVRCAGRGPAANADFDPAPAPPRIRDVTAGIDTVS